MLPLDVDDEGFFVASSDYRETVGPDFWERP
jgi:ubiquinol-cytochrome c reductase iron-sulfur subunit